MVKKKTKKSTFGWTSQFSHEAFFLYKFCIQKVSETLKVQDTKLKWMMDFDWTFV